MSKANRRKITLLASAAIGLWTAPAFAQSVTPPEPASPATPPEQAATPAEAATTQAPNPTRNGDEGLGDIVVTAQRRAQNLREVPTAITAITSETLQARGVQQITDLPALTPSLTVTQGTDPLQSSINLRGVGTSAFSIAIEPSVAVIVDDVPLLQQAQAFSGLSDLERIEVLRGPQGTLFGKNASAGAINIVTQAPTRTFTGHVGLSATTDEEYRGDLSLSGPIGTNAGFRVNGFYVNRDGYLYDTTTRNTINGTESWGLRARFDFHIGSTADVTVSASHSNEMSNGLERTFRNVPAGASIFGTPVAPLLAAAGITPGADNFRTAANQEPDDRSRQTTLVGRATFHLGGADLVSITSYQTFHFQFLEDFDFTQLPLLTISSPFDTRQFTQELRLVSTGSRTFSYVAGLFYQNGSSDRSFIRAGLPSAAANWTASSTSRSYAAYAQATLNLSHTSHLDGGIRLNRQETGAEFTNLQIPTVAPANNATCLQTCSGNIGDTAVIGKIAFRQDLSPLVTAYASFATGYKGPGYDVSTGFSPSRITNPVRPERSRAYELGVKGRLFDNHMNLAVAAFWTDYTNFQAQSAVQLADGTLSFVLNNVGRLRTRGIEVESTIRLSHAFRIDASANYTDARIRSFNNAPCFTGQTDAQGCYDLDGAGPSTVRGQNLAGARLADSPEVRFTVGGTYDLSMPHLPFDGFLSASVSHQSSSQYDLSQNPGTIQRGYEIVNASFGVVGHNTPYHLTFFVNNIFDKAYAVSLVVPSGGSTGLIAQIQPRDARRYGGVRLRLDF